MSELKVASVFEFEKILRGKSNKLFYPKSEVDAAIAAKDAEIRRLKRALWLARAEKARFLAMIINHHASNEVLHFTSNKRDNTGKHLGIGRIALEWYNMFQEVERKCRAKAEEYK